jgi:hypothetical protein
LCCQGSVLLDLAGESFLFLLLLPQFFVHLCFDRIDGRLQRLRGS